jgi:hypothetical protein
MTFVFSPKTVSRMAGFCSSAIAPRQLLLRCPTTTTTDGESADIAGAIICPYIHGHMHCPTKLHVTMQYLHFLHPCRSFHGVSLLAAPGSHPLQLT